MNGNNLFQTARFKKNIAADAGLNSLIYVGDAVSVTADGTVKTYQQVSATRACLGVAARVLINEAGRPRVHGLPDQHPNISLTAQPDYIDVYTDPGIVYEVYLDVSAGASMIGQGANVATTARVTGSGFSGHLLSLTPNTSAVAPFKIVSVSDFDLDGDRQGDDQGRVHAIVNYQIFKSLADF